MADAPEQPPQHQYLRKEFWYSYNFETAGETEETKKVIVHQVMFRTTTLQPDEFAHFPVAGPPLTALFKFMLGNLGVLDLKNAYAMWRMFRKKK